MACVSGLEHFYCNEWGMSRNKEQKIDVARQFGAEDCPKGKRNERPEWLGS